VKEDLVEAADAYIKAVDKDGFLKSLESAGINFKPVIEE
jgi:hypothetical protein